MQEEKPLSWLLDSSGTVIMTDDKFDDSHVINTSSQTRASLQRSTSPENCSQTFSLSCSKICIGILMRQYQVMMRGSGAYGKEDGPHFMMYVFGMI